MGDFLIWLSGASTDVLRRCPTERPKFLGIGAAILVTAGMAAVSMAFALYSAVKVPIPLAVLFALLWGLAILSLDRLFVTSMRRYRNRLYSLLMALPRVLMAVLLGFVISTPFVLQIFRPEINQQIALAHDKEQSAFYASLPKNSVYLTVQKDKAEVQTLTSEAASGGPAINPATDPVLANLNQQLTAAESAEATAFANLQCQLYGTTLPGGRQCIQGNGPIAQDDQQAYESAKNQVATLTQQVQAREAELGNQSTAQQAAGKVQYASELETAKQSLSAAEQELNQLESQTVGNINSDSGLLTQLSGLSAATASSASLRDARFLLFLVFLVIDIMPVFIKLLLNLAEESPYDIELAAEEKRQAMAAENNRAARLAMERQADQAQVAMARERLAGLTASLPQIRDEIIAARQRVENEWVRRWEEAQIREVEHGQVRPDVAPGPTPLAVEWQRPPDVGAGTGPSQGGGGAGRPGDQAQPTRPWEQRSWEPQNTEQVTRAWGEQEPRTRRSRQRQEGLIARLLGRDTASRRRKEGWRSWPTNGAAQPTDTVGGRSVP